LTLGEANYLLWPSPARRKSDIVRNSLHRFHFSKIPTNTWKPSYTISARTLIHHGIIKGTIRAPDEQHIEQLADKSVSSGRQRSEAQGARRRSSRKRDTAKGSVIAPDDQYITGLLTRVFLQAINVQKRKKRNEETTDLQQHNEELLAKVLNLYGAQCEIASHLLSGEFLALSLVSKRIRGLVNEDLYIFNRECDKPVELAESSHASNPCRCPACDAIFCSRCEPSLYDHYKEQLCELCTRWRKIYSTVHPPLGPPRRR